jgi:peroxiredoxin (alkyl hydroperoxide reductase subunit C)
MAVSSNGNTCLPHIGEIAPIFDAISTQGNIKLEDFRGGWLILFSHPADFQPVGSTELVAFAQLQPELKKRGVKIIGLSVDSLPSHIAWVRSIQEKMGVKIDFPLIADHDRYISLLYGMIHPGQSGTLTVRCVFIIDPRQIIRAILYYPVTVGRNTDEILRLIDALQLSDRETVSTPANWRPGDMVIVPPPTTQAAAEETAKENYEYTDWYLRKKKPQK